MVGHPQLYANPSCPNTNNIFADLEALGWEHSYSVPRKQGGGMDYWFDYAG